MKHKLNLHPNQASSMPKGSSAIAFPAEMLKSTYSPNSSQPRELYNAGIERVNNTFGKKLTTARKNAGISQKGLADKLATHGFSLQPAAISKWEQGVSSPNVYQLFAICSILGIDNPLETFTTNSTKEDASPTLNYAGMKRLQEYYELLVTSGRFVPTPVSLQREEETDMKVFDLPAAAGIGTPTDEETYSYISFPVSSIPYGAEFGVKVSGDSMMPRYVNGQIVWVEENTELTNGEIGIFNVNGEAFIKQLSLIEPDADEIDDYTDSDGVVHPKVLLVSLNTDFPNIPIHESDTFKIVGRVLN